MSDQTVFMFPGQGSQYVGMLGGLKAVEPIVQRTFAEADAVYARALTALIDEAKK